jgi:transposase-like protein
MAASDVVAAESGGRRRYSDAQRLRALELVDCGCSWAEGGREVGVPKTTVGTWVRKRQRCHSVATPTGALTTEKTKAPR